MLEEPTATATATATTTLRVAAHVEERFTHVVIYTRTVSRPIRHVHGAFGVVFIFVGHKQVLILSRRHHHHHGLSAALGSGLWTLHHGFVQVQCRYQCGVEAKISFLLAGSPTPKVASIVSVTSASHWAASSPAGHLLLSMTVRSYIQER